jgi:hypothetical protein
LADHWAEILWLKEGQVNEGEEVGHIRNSQLRNIPIGSKPLNERYRLIAEMTVSKKDEGTHGLRSARESPPYM